MADIDISSDSVATTTVTASLTRAIAMSASVVALTVTSAALDNSSKYISASSLATTVTTATLQVTNTNLEAYSVATVSDGSIVLDRQPQLAASSFSVSTTAARINKNIQLSANVVARTPTKASLNPGRGTLGVCDLMDEILWLWGLTNYCSVDKHIKERAINDINASLQVLWSKARDVDYWSRTTLNVNFTTAQKTAILPDNVQNIVGHVRLINGQPLAPLQTRGELDSYPMYYLGTSTREMLNDTPQAYYSERLNQSGEDPVRINLHVIPQPHEDMEVLVDVVTESPRYRCNDVLECTSVPIPHKYVESILLPIVRYRAMSFYLFIKPERTDMIIAEYQEALIQLGVNDPIQGKEEAND